MPRKISKQALDAIDSMGSDKSGFDISSQLSALEQVAGDFIQRVHENLEAEGAIVSGEIADIQVQVVDNGIEITANPWLVYQDKGVNGSVEKRYDTPFAYTTKRPPIQGFIEWVKARNIQTRHNEKHSGKKQSFKEASKENDVRSIAYAVRENVFKYGIKPKNVYTKELPKLIEDATEIVANITIKEIFNKL